MKRKLILLILLLSLILFHLPLPAQEKYTGQSIEDVLELPENEINVGMATLILAKEFYPDLDVNSFLYAFEYMAEKFNYFFGKYRTPDERIKALNTYFYRKGYGMMV